MLRVTALSVRYGETLALDRVDLTVGRGEIVAVLGASGSGKTTLLRAIAGLEHPTTGAITWDGESVAHTPPHRRGFGLMFQDHALFSHLDVRGNVEFGLRMRGRRPRPDNPRPDISARTRDVLDLVRLAGFERRRVDQLSGGEQQRVALARTLAPSPRLLMLDEPLASVDREQREHLASELHRIIRVAAMPTLLVTHDLDEAFTLADVVVVLDRGRVERCGPARTVWSEPGSITVARFLGVATELILPVADRTVRTPWGPLPAPAAADRAWVGFRPGDLRVDRRGAVTATVREVWFRRDHFLLNVDTEFGPMTATGPRSFDPGATVGIHADVEAAVVLDA